MIRGDAIRKAVLDKKKPAELVWIADDIDPYRSVPKGFPEELKNYLGVPVAMIPDPWKCHKNFALHFEEMIMQQLKMVGVSPKVMPGLEMYQKGAYNDSIKTTMEKRKEIVAILNKYREEPLEVNWQPINIICEKCGKMVTTKILSYDSKTFTVEYECSTEEAKVSKTATVRGCGYRGKASILNGRAKLTWRVEWAARWAFLKATCEPFGKEHAASGGSWDTGMEIVKLFGREPPVPVIYEHFQVEGGKMSKSKGNVITVPILLELMRPQELKFWMYFGKISKARDINFVQMPIQVAEEFDKAERIYFGEKSGNDREDSNYKRAYELSAMEVFKRVVQAPYTFCVDIVQTSKGREIEVLEKTGHLPADLTASERKEIEARLENCRNWLRQYAPEEYKIKLLEKVPNIAIDAKTKELFALTADKLEKGASGEELQNFIYNSAKQNNLDIKKTFAIAYQLILGRDKGPRLGHFLVSLDRKFAVERLRLKN
jgi:lysyl-tRNA synthetase class 1